MIFFQKGVNFKVEIIISGLELRGLWKAKYPLGHWLLLCQYASAQCHFSRVVDLQMTSKTLGKNSVVSSLWLSLDNPSASVSFWPRLYVIVKL